MSCNSCIEGEWVRCAFITASSNKETGKNGLSDRCMLGLWLKHHKGVEDKRLMEVLVNMAMADHLKEARAAINHCPVESAEHCPIAAYMPRLEKKVI